MVKNNSEKTWKIIEVLIPIIFGVIVITITWLGVNGLFSTLEFNLSPKAEYYNLINTKEYPISEKDYQDILDEKGGEIYLRLKDANSDNLVQNRITLNNEIKDTSSSDNRKIVLKEYESNDKKFFYFFKGKWFIDSEVTVLDEIKDSK